MIFGQKKTVFKHSLWWGIHGKWVLKHQKDLLMTENRYPRKLVHGHNTNQKSKSSSAEKLNFIFNIVSLIHPVQSTINTIESRQHTGSAAYVHGAWLLFSWSTWVQLYHSHKMYLAITEYVCTDTHGKIENFSSIFFRMQSVVTTFKYLLNNKSILYIVFCQNGMFYFWTV